MKLTNEKLHVSVDPKYRDPNSKSVNTARTQVRFFILKVATPIFRREINESKNKNK